VLKTSLENTLESLPGVMCWWLKGYLHLFYVVFSYP